MNKINYNEKNLCIDDIKYIIKNFDSYEYIYKELDVILKSIDSDIDYIIFDDDKTYKKLHLYLLDNYCYGINYDFKNYPLISFSCNEIIIHSIDTVIGFDENLLINLFELDFKTFDKIN